VKPALTPEEWKIGEDSASVLGDGTTDYDYGYAGLCSDGTLHINLWEYTYEGSGRHALAALALHGQPFGFTRAMVDILADALEGAINDGWGHNDERALAAQAIENIRALLPPEAK
jgi:hypothetical protein